MTYSLLNEHPISDLKAMRFSRISDIGIKPTSAKHKKSMSAVAKRVHNFVRIFQLGRMNSVLHSMPDEVIAEIGISRSEIPEYAHKLIYGQDI